jgi:hypothetical protein
MKKFIKKALQFSSFGISIVAIVSVLYFVLDPFKVLYEYDDYSSFTEANVSLNRDFISTMSYLKKKDDQKFNSFIFGSSRTLAYDPSYWASKLDSSDVPFVFDATAESIYGISTKIKYLDDIGAPIDNALIILCTDYTFASSKNPTNHVTIKHPQLTKESRIDFQLTFFKVYFNWKFLASYFISTFTDYHFDFMNDYINKNKLKVNPQNNRLSKVADENLLSSSEDEFYIKNESRFYRTSDNMGRLVNKIIFPSAESAISRVQINSKTEKMLKEIESIFAKNHTQYKVVLHPLINKKKFNETDFNTLTQVFKENLYDFTGKNEFTKSYRNFYDWSHCRPFVGEKIIDLIYYQHNK